ncbi:putative autophagy-related protein 11 isoform X2 [Clytia hemisphaerica]|uniref:putative autophagy-related protein 11 isoform X2 n=1 Tax=Clytia hemisphaerica TaxID=252671 RepID=UPI0034D4187E
MNSKVNQVKMFEENKHIDGKGSSSENSSKNLISESKKLSRKAMQQKIDQLQRSLDQYKNEVNDYKEEKSTMEEVIDDLNEDLYQQEFRVNTVEDECGELKYKLQNMSQRNEELEEKFEKLRQLMTLGYDEHIQLKKSNKQLLHNNGEMQKALDFGLVKYQNLQYKMQTVEEKNIELEEQLGQQENLLERYHQDDLKADKYLVELEHQKMELENAYEFLIERSMKRDAEYKNADTEIFKLRAICQNLQDDNSKNLKRVVRDANKRFRAKTRQLLMSKAKCVQHIQVNSFLKEEVKNLKKCLSENDIQFGNASAEILKLRAVFDREVQIVKDEVFNLRRSHDNLEQQNTANLAFIKKLETENNAFKQKVSSMKKDIVYWKEFSADQGLLYDKLKSHDIAHQARVFDLEEENNKLKEMVSSSGERQQKPKNIKRCLFKFWRRKSTNEVPEGLPCNRRQQ